MSARRWASPGAGDLLDLMLVLALAGTAQYEIWVRPLFDDGIPGPQLPNAVLLLLITVPLAWRRRAPTIVFVLVLVSVAVQVSLIDGTLSDQPPFQHWIALLVVFYSLGVHAERRRAIIAGALGGGAFVVADLVDLLTGAGRLEDTVPAWFMLAAAYGIGLAMRGERIQSTLLTQRTERLEREREQQARQAVAEERARIARELHDIVAHAISVMVVQAQAGQRVLEGEQASAREALGSIETMGRQSLVEMRRLLGVLRVEDRELALGPYPRLADLDVLADRVRHAGLPVEVHVEGEPTSLPPGVDLSGYRIVQEALTNALRHAGPATAKVVVRYRPAEVEVEITDDGRGNAEDREGGHGLVGMRERAALVGGDLESGSENERGYTVRARLPA
ncbi:sensor histidine kinase [Aeromicrobium sp.]|uniref:sensor histidine kinase n=1 Tax=Aeromicrobium sp. TaxID=1871063 RepID=UPI003D6A2EAA